MNSPLCFLLPSHSRSLHAFSSPFETQAECVQGLLRNVQKFSHFKQPSGICLRKRFCGSSVVRIVVKSTQNPDQLKPLKVTCIQATEGGSASSEDRSMLLKYWLGALNPLTYSAAIISVVVGAVAARRALALAGALELFSWKRFGFVMLGEIMLQAWLNISNDAYDADTGVDKNRKDNLVNLTGSVPAVHALALLCLAVGAASIFLANNAAPSNIVIKIAATGFALGYMYQCPPFRFSYLGLGEPMTFVAFGPLAVLASYFSLAPTYTPLALLASLPVAFTVTSMIFASHFPQVDDDRKHGKRGPVVRLGIDRAATVYPWAVIVPAYASVAALIMAGVFPPLAGIYVFAAPLALRLAKGVKEFAAGTTRSKPIKWAVLHHVLSGSLLAAALWPW